MHKRMSAKERIQQLKEQQNGVELPEVQHELREKAITAINAINNGHSLHHKEQIGPCVYCIDCTDEDGHWLRLYQGKLSKEK